jgi:phosphohistidine phosphatase
MKTIFFVRHAKAIEHVPSIEDFDRSLIDKGIKNAHLMGKLLSQQHEKPQLVISSPAARAMHTAIIISKELNYPYSKIMLEEKLYESSIGNYFQVIKKINDTIQTVFLFAHNPTITEVCNSLIDASIGIDDIPTSGVVGIRFDINTWQKIETTKGTLILFDFPKKHGDSGS